MDDGASLPAEFRKEFYTTNATETVTMSVRKASKNLSSFPYDDALLKLFYWR